MPISITEDIRSVSELQLNANAILDHLHATKRPVILTVDGKADAVLVDASEYEKNMSAFNLLKMLIPAEEDIKAGKYSDAASFLEGFNRAKGV